MATSGGDQARAEPMLELVARLPEQMAACADLVDAADFSGIGKVDRVLFCGMGGSAAAGELARGIFQKHDFGFEVNRSYTLPGAIDSNTLLIFSSYSGNTEETLSAYDQARELETKPSRLVVCSGGALLQRAAEDRAPHITIPDGLPPRASLGFGMGVLVSVLGRLGLVSDARQQIEECVAVLREGNQIYGDQVPPSENRARRLARRLYGKLPLLYAGVGLAEAAAHRIKAQINENAKALAFVSVFPELDHNEIVGWRGATRAREDAYVLALRDRGDHPRLRRRFDLTREILGESVHDWDTFESQGESPLARAMSLVQFGDYLSVYLAGEYGVEATPVSVIEELKQRLADQDG